MQTAAPFLQWDADPYPVVLDGKIIWVLDGYTTTNRYPYSQSINPQVPAGSGLATGFNYVRNSVKATVDSYDGTIHFYVVDPERPDHPHVPQGLPRPVPRREGHARGLQEHWRYPDDIFDTQTEQYTQYHMTDPQQFFQKAALWDIAPSPGASDQTDRNTVAPVNGNNGGRNSTLAVERHTDRPAVSDDAAARRRQRRTAVRAPATVRAAAKGNQLSAFMMAGNDGPNYGKLTLYQVPDNSVAPSPSGPRR